MIAAPWVPVSGAVDPVDGNEVVDVVGVVAVTVGVAVTVDVVVADDVVVAVEVTVLVEELAPVLGKPADVDVVAKSFGKAAMKL